jgi:hypothetical protein
MQVDVLQKHASILDRVQLAHAEAIELATAATTTTTTTGTSDDGWTNDLDNDSFHDKVDVKGTTKKTTTKKKDDKTKTSVEVVAKKKLSIKEQIQEIANFIGTTTIWDKPPVATTTTTTTTEDTLGEVEEEDKPKIDPKEVEEEDDGAVDVDKFVGSFDDDDDDEEGANDDEDFHDLPLLKDAIIDPYTITGSPGTSSSKRRKKKRSRSKRKVPEAPTSGMIGLQPVDEKYVIQNPVVLDQQSSKHAYFMDQLLFTGSLLESHYVQYASVVGLEDNYSSSYFDYGESKSSKKDDMSSTTLNKHGLVIITADDILHLFEIPTSPTISSNNSFLSNTGGISAELDEVKIMPGCNPEDALLALLKQNASADLIMKEQQDIQALMKEKSSPILSSPSKLSTFLRSKTASTTNTKDENPCFQFQNMAPSISMPLVECTVRQSLNGQCSVRISHNSVNPRIASNKLIFAHAMDQKAFLEATRTDVTLWDLK